METQWLKVNHLKHEKHSTAQYRKCTCPSLLKWTQKEFISQFDLNQKLEGLKPSSNKSVTATCMLLESQFNTIDQQQPILCQKNHIILLKCQHFKAVTGSTLALGTSWFALLKFGCQKTCLHPLTSPHAHVQDYQMALFWALLWLNGSYPHTCIT